MNFGEESVSAREKQSVLAVKSSVDIRSKNDLSIYYTPGIASVSKIIANDKKRVYDLTVKRNTVAVISDGSAVLGLGNIGPEAALPVMEGKSMLFSQFAGIDAFPICLATQDTEEIIVTIRNIAPAFGGINLEDISAPRCFEIEERLQDLGIPVMHDDQHGTAVVVLAGLINALKVSKKNIDNLRIIISGAGAAGTAITKMIEGYFHNVNMIVVDRGGAIFLNRPGLSESKKELVSLTKNKERGSLSDVIKKSDVFIGVSAPGVLTGDMVRTMKKNPIIFAMANPVSEIDPQEAKKAGAFIVATGRSDYPNQLNNVLSFPGIFRGALDVRAKKITKAMLLSASLALASYLKKPTKEQIIPSPLDKGVVVAVSRAVADSSK